MNFSGYFKKTSCAFNTFIQSLPSAWSFPGTLEGSKNHNFAETRLRPQISTKFTSDQPLVHYGQTIWEADFKNNPKIHWGRKHTKCKAAWLRADHSTTLQCTGLADHVTLNFNSKMSTAAVFLDIEKAFDTTWHSGLLYKLSELEFSTSLIKLIASFLTDRKFKVLVEGELTTEKKSGRGSWRFRPCHSIVQSLYDNRSPRSTWHSSCSARGRYLYLRERNTKAVFPVNCNADSLQWIRGVSAGTWRSMKGKLRRSISPEGLESLATYCN
jgi:hypothetical protein